MNNCKICNKTLKKRFIHYISNKIIICDECSSKIFVIKANITKSKNIAQSLKEFLIFINFLYYFVRKLLSFFLRHKIQYNLINQNRQKLAEIYLNKEFISEIFPFFKNKYLKKNIETFVWYFGIQKKINFVQSFYLKKYLNLYLNQTPGSNLLEYIDLDLIVIKELNKLLYAIEENNYLLVLEEIDKKLKYKSIFEDESNFSFYLKLVFMSEQEKIKMPLIQKKLQNYIINSSFNKLEDIKKVMLLIINEYDEIFSLEFINFLRSRLTNSRKDNFETLLTNREKKIELKKKIDDNFNFNVNNYKHNFINYNPYNLNQKKNTNQEQISKIDLNKENFCVYTCLFGNYDSLKEFKNLTDINFYCFTDEQKKHSVWQSIIFNQENNNFLNSRKPKIIPFEFLKNYKYSLYIDANYFIKTFTNEKLNILKNLINKNSYFFNHPQRKLLRDEILRIYLLRKDYKKTIDSILEDEKFRKFFNEDLMIEASFILRNHNAQNLQKCMYLWWEYVKNLIAEIKYS